MAFALAPGLSVDNARRTLARAFRDHGLDTPDLDARLLTAHTLGLNHTELAAAVMRVLSCEEADRLVESGARRLQREPVARILGRKEFWSLTLQLTDAVLVPRPETETVVEAALNAVETSGARSRPLRILDIGTGSGALLLALLSELPSAFGVGTDRAPAAVAVARANAEGLGLGNRSAFLVCDHAAALAGPFDLVVANPPYIATADLAQLEPEVREHDPRLALDGGPDGLRSYRVITADARRLLAPHAHLIVEIGIGQSVAVTALLATAGLSPAPVIRDLAGASRAIAAKKCL